MTTVIYADILFLLNLFSDFIILFLTGLFSGTGLRFLRTLFSAALGAVFGTVLLCIGNIGAAAAVITVAFPAVMCFSAFGKRSISAFANIVFYFYLSSVLLFGGTYAMVSVLHMLFSVADIKGKALIVFLLIAAVALIYYVFSSFCGRGIRRKQDLVTAELFDGIKTYTLDLLVDSGNMVKDPFSLKPVAIISAQSLDEELVCAVCDSDRENQIYTDIHPRVIPIKTVSGTALLYAFIPESMCILTNGKKMKADCIVAIDSRNNPFFGRDGIVPASLLETL